MQIGVPKEIKNLEFRVGLSPSSVKVLTQQGHQVIVETDAGLGAGFSNTDYEQTGAQLGNAVEVWQQPMVVKVKEPLVQEYDSLQKEQLLFTYLHLAANRELTEVLLKSGATAIAYETVEKHQQRPLLQPMSMIAGRLSVQFGARFLEKQQGGRGVLLGGIPGVNPGHVVVLGGGIVGTEATKMAVGLGAQVTLIDIDLDRLNQLEELFGSRIKLLYSNPVNIENAVSQADLLIGAVLVPGRQPPTLVSRSLVERMPTGAVIIDVAVDQGGCIETMRPTSHSEPIYIESEVLHYGVPNMPGAVPRTATEALNNSTLPYVLKLASTGLKALDTDTALATGLNVVNHQLVHPAVKATFPDLG